MAFNKKEYMKEYMKEYCQRPEVKAKKHEKLTKICNCGRMTWTRNGICGFCKQKYRGKKFVGRGSVGRAFRRRAKKA